MPAASDSSSRLDGLKTFSIVAASSILFCSKGGGAKLAYTHGVDAMTVLALRMGFALPFFLILFLLLPSGPRLSLLDWGRLAGLGFLGQYVTAVVNFEGLQYVTVGMERILLYTYPSMVLAISAFVLRKPVPGRTWIACGVAWIGIVIAYVGEKSVSGANTTWGALLILASAFTYALFILMSGNMVRRVGALRFTAIAVGFSCIFMLIHYRSMRPFSALLSLPEPVYIHGLMLAIFGTVAPALLLGIGLKRAGAQKFAIIGAIGPVTTIFFAWWLLGELPNFGQSVGFALTLGGGLAISLLKERSPASSRQG